MTDTKAPDATDSRLKPIVTYECPLSGTEHAIPSDDVRVMKSGDGDFEVACSCGEQALEHADERPHPTPDQYVHINANAPTPAEWLRLEDCADGWYAVEPWEPPEGYSGTRAQRRARVRERAEEIADTTSDSGIDEDRHAAARDVLCPSCGANAGRKCKRPGGHRVRKCHSDRLERADAGGKGGADRSEHEQVLLGRWSA